MVQRNLREPSPKTGGVNKWLIATSLGGVVALGAFWLGSSEAPPLLPETAKPNAAVATSGPEWSADLPADYSHLFKPEPAVLRVVEPGGNPVALAPEVIAPERPPRAPVARCVRPPTTYAPGNLHQANMDAGAYRDCLAQRSYTLAMEDYAWRNGGGAMAQNSTSASPFSPSVSGSQTSGAHGGGSVAPASAQTSQTGSSGTSVARDRHEDFQSRAAENTALFHAQEPEELPIDECVVMAGSKIPAVLLNSVNTGAAGTVAAQVSYDVRDVTGNCIAIPAGSRLVGRYDHITGYGQNRLGIAWEALTLPDYTTVSLAGLGAADVSGTAGVEGDVNNHNLSFFGAVILGSLVEAAPAIAGLKADVSFGGVASDAGSAGQQIIERELNRQPTITIEAGTEVSVDVHKHLVMGAR